MIIRQLNEKDYLQYYNLINQFRKTFFNENDFINLLRMINKNSEISSINIDDEHYGYWDGDLITVTIGPPTFNGGIQATAHVVLDGKGSIKEIVIDNKVTLLEFLTQKPVDKAQVKDQILEEYAKQDKGTRILIYKMIVEKFNEKYSDLLPEQKSLLKEFINNVSNTVTLKEYINNQIQNVKLELEILSKKVQDKKIQIKLNEVNSILNLIPKSESVNDDDVLNLMNYYELRHELRAV